MICIGQHPIASPGLVLTQFVNTVHRRMLFILTQQELDELNARLVSFMSPKEAEEFARRENPFVKPNAVWLRVIEAKQPLPDADRRADEAKAL